MSSQPKVRASHVKRWLFRTVVVLAFLFLVLTLRVIFIEADMSLGLSRARGTGLQGLVINKQNYEPPINGVVKPSQLSLLIHVVETLDSLDRADADDSKSISAFADVLNQYTTSISEYRWIRSMAMRFEKAVHRDARNLPRADSLNVERMRMFSMRFAAHSRFFRDSLDKEALKQ